MTEHRAPSGYDTMKPGENFYLMRLHVSCYSLESRNPASWEVLGKMSDLGDNFLASDIVVGKLIKQ